MKTLLIVSIFMLHALNLSAQKIIDKSFEMPSSGKIDIDLKFADIIKISTWDKNTITFKASIDLNNGLLNDSLKHEFITGEILTIRSEINKKFNNWMSKRNYDQDEDNIRFWSGNEGFIISEITYELKVPQKSLIKLNTINADVEIRDLSNSMEIKTINGFVDINWFEKKAANFEMKTINGEVYSDLDDLVFLNKKNNPIVGYNLKASFKEEASTEVKLKSINGNIYLR
ncbi:MAG: hypothetical protein AAGI07_12790, partial [Bacteroidota bacterium]